MNLKKIENPEGEYQRECQIKDVRYLADRLQKTTAPQKSLGFFREKGDGSEMLPGRDEVSRSKTLATELGLAFVNPTPSMVAYSDALWPLIPMQSGHPFRFNLATLEGVTGRRWIIDSKAITLLGNVSGGGDGTK